MSLHSRNINSMENLSGPILADEVKMEYYSFFKNVAMNLLCKVDKKEVSSRSIPLNTFVEKYKESENEVLRSFTGSIEDYDSILEKIDLFTDELILRKSVLMLDVYRNTFDSIKDLKLNDIEAKEFYFGLASNIIRDFQNYLLRHERVKQRARLDSKKEVAELATSFRLCLEGEYA